MKVLIFLGFWVVAITIHTIFTANGIILGGLPAALLYGPASFFGILVGNQAAWNAALKAAQKANKSPLKYATMTLREDYLDWLDSLKEQMLTQNILQALRDCKKKGILNRHQYLILYMYYIKDKEIW